MEREYHYDYFQDCILSLRKEQQEIKETLKRNSEEKDFYERKFSQNAKQIVALEKYQNKTISIK